MSAYKVIDCFVKNKDHVVAALVEIGVPKRCIEIYEDAANLVGFKGDTRSQKANIIVRQRYVNQYLSGGASNDIGFEKVNGVYNAHISQYDMQWWKRKQGKFKQSTGMQATLAKAQQIGYHIQKKKENGKIFITLEKNY